MTIDESIALERQVAKEQRDRIGTFDDEYSKKCEVYAEEHEQLAEWLEEMAGQLKGQKKTCFDCKNHFMSDCYLECYKHERINNDSICDDFE